MDREVPCLWIEATTILQNAVDRVRARRLIGRLCGVLSCLAGALVLAGWAMDSPTFKSIRPGLATMKPNTALSFLLAGVSLGCAGGADSAAGFRRRALAVFCALGVVGVGLLTLFEYGAGVDLGIDQWLFLDPAPSVGVVHPGRMAMATATIFSMIGISLILLHLGAPAAAFQSVAACAFISAAFCLLSYMYELHSLQEVFPFASVALHTAATFVVLTTGVLAASESRGLLALADADDVGGLIVRRMLPAAIVIPALIGLLRSAGQRAGLYGPEFGLSLHVTSMTVVFAALIFWTADQIQRVDADRQALHQSLLASEDRLRRIIENAPLGVAMFDRDMRCLAVSRQWLRGLREFLTEQNVLGKRLYDVYPGLAQRWKDLHSQALAGETIRAEADPFERGEGRTQWLRWEMQPWQDDDGRSGGIVVFVEDVTARVKAEQALRDSERIYRAIGESIDYGVWICDPEGKNVYASQSFLDLVGQTQEQCSAFGWGDVLHPDDSERTIAAWKECVRMGGRWDIEHRFRGVDGRWHPILARRVPVEDEHGRVVRWAGINLDIRRLKEAEDALRAAHDQLEQKVQQRTAELLHLNQRLRASIAEKEILLKEIHHRVKNNLQIVSALLDLQADHTADPSALQMFKESRGRVRSMALVHERLYQAKDLAHIDFEEYIRRLADDLYHSFAATNDAVKLKLHVDAPAVSLDLAVPCGLLINELTSNCFKHAFVGREQGNIDIRLLENDGEYELIVADDGVGLPAGLDLQRSSSFGMQLVQTLVEQLRGRIELSNEPGARFSIRFRGQKNAYHGADA